MMDLETVGVVGRLELLFGTKKKLYKPYIMI